MNLMWPLESSKISFQGDKRIYFLHSRPEGCQTYLKASILNQESYFSTVKFTVEIMLVKAQNKEDTIESLI